MNLLYHDRLVCKVQKPISTVSVKSFSSFISIRHPVCLSTTSVSRALVESGSFDKTECRAEGKFGKIIQEVRGLTPEAAPELPELSLRAKAEKKDFRPSNPPLASSNRLSRYAEGVRKSHRRQRQFAATSGPASRSCVLTVIKVLIDWGKNKKDLLEACLLSGIKREMYRSFYYATCGSAVSCRGEDILIKNLGSKSHSRRLFNLKLWSCSKCCRCREGMASNSFYCQFFE